MDTAGAIIGPLLGLAFFSIFLWKGISEELSYRLIFFIAALPTIISVFIIATKTREVRSFEKAPEEQKSASPQTSKIKGILTQHKVLLLFTVISCLFALWAVTENFMLVAATKILGISRANRAQVLIVVILYWFINATYAPSALYSGSLSDKIGRKIPVLISFVILAVLTLGFAFVTKYWQISILFACHGIYQGFLKPSQKALVADLAPTEIRGTIMGTYSWAIGISAIPATAIFGLLWDLSGGWKLPFLLSGVFIALCALLLGLFVHEPKWAEEDS
jgi:MFS family permease